MIYSGIPLKDVDEVAGYVRVMGEFVGRPVNASLMKRAGEAQAKIVLKIKEWCESAHPESRLRTDGNYIQSVDISSDVSRVDYCMT